MRRAKYESNAIPIATACPWRLDWRKTGQNAGKVVTREGRGAGENSIVTPLCGSAPETPRPDGDSFDLGVDGTWSLQRVVAIEDIVDSEQGG